MLQVLGQGHTARQMMQTKNLRKTCNITHFQAHWHSPASLQIRRAFPVEDLVLKRMGLSNSIPALEVSRKGNVKKKKKSFIFLIYFFLAIYQTKISLTILLSLFNKDSLLRGFSPKFRSI